MTIENEKVSLILSLTFMTNSEADQRALYFIVVFIYMLFFKGRSKKKLSKDRRPQSEPPPKRFHSSKKIKYFVNGKLIPGAFGGYYYVKLRMPFPVIDLNLAILERYYQKIIQYEGPETPSHEDTDGAKKAKRTLRRSKS